MTVYYNEIDEFAAQWLRNLIAKGLIAPGDVDERSIADVDPDDLLGYDQCHFFAGIGGWSLAMRMAGWSDDRPAWTGSCPCQPFSVAGRGGGFTDERHLWPEQRRLIAKRRPPVWFGEQVAKRKAVDWLRCVRSDLEALGYAVGAIPIEAASAGAPHLRDRIWIVADSDRQRGSRLEPSGGAGKSGQWGWRGQEDLQLVYSEPFTRHRWPEPLVRRLDDGLSGGLDRVRSIKGFGNAITPQVAAGVISAYMECAP